jgi:hypothetical protein
MSTKLERMEKRIRRIKQQLTEIGPMRPGSLTRQYRLPKEKKRPFYQISYTHRMRSRTEYVRPDNLDIVRRETANYKKFRKLIDQWIELALETSRLRLKSEKK